MRRLFMIMMGILLILPAFGQSASAYSYGDPNREELAEVYKQMQVALNEASPDFTKAGELFATMKKEIDMHMGTEPAETVTTHLNAKDKEAVIDDMRKILVLNISRRLSSIENDFQDFNTSKKLLAKGFATYEALSPVIKQEDPKLDESLRQEFDQALQALGNPGLFGVGVKEPNLEGFQSSKETILTSLQDVFNLASLEVGHFTEGTGQNEESAAGPSFTDRSDLKNWIPLVVILLAVIAILFYASRRKRGLSDK